MESLFSGNTIVLYFIVIMLILKPTNLKENQKVFFVYIVAALMQYTNNLNGLTITVITLLVMLLYMEFFNTSEFRKHIMISIKHKILDFFYIMFAENCLLRFILYMFFSSELFFIHYTNIFGFEHSEYILIVIRLIILLSIANDIYAENWKAKELDDMKYIITSMKHINNTDYLLTASQKNIVTMLEDKTYFKRKKFGTAYTIEYFKLAVFPKIIRKISFTNKVIKNELTYKTGDGLLNKLIKFRKYDVWVIINSFKSTAVYLKEAISRGHSTIDAQLVRSIGIEHGYNGKFINVIKRKLFEQIYTNLFLNNWEAYYKKMFYSNAGYMKDYLLYAYLNLVRVEVQGHSYKGLKNVFGKDVTELNEDEMFIGVFCFSHYHPTAECIKNYAAFYGYDIDIDRIEDIFKEIDNYWYKLNN